MKPIYPITTFNNVIDESTNKTLTETLGSIGHYNIGEVKTKAEARFKLPSSCRVKGIYVTYVVDNIIYTDVFKVNADEVDDDTIINDSYWHNVHTIEL